MLDIKNPIQAYEVFKLQWMIEHVATLSDLVITFSSCWMKIWMGLTYQRAFRVCFLAGNLDLVLMVLFGLAIRSSWSTIIR